MVNTSSRRFTPDRIGLAISSSDLWASFVGSRAEPVVKHFSLARGSDDSGEWSDLARIFAELRDELGGGKLAISLMAPLAEVRMVELPPLRDDDAERLLSRNAGKYFVGARQAQIVGVARGGRTAKGTLRPVLAAAAPARLVATVHAAARAAGFIVDSIGPAESAWAAAATSLWPAFNRGTAYVAVAQADRTDLLRIEAGRLAAVRRFRAGATDVALIAEAVGTAGNAARIGVLGERETRSALARALGGGRLTVSVSNDANESGAPLATLAAAFAGPASGPLFRTEDVRVSSQNDAWRATRVVGAAAVVLFAAGAAIHLWGVQRQLRLVREERQQIAPKLSATLIGRSSVENVYRTMSALGAMQRTIPEWSRSVVALTEALPSDAYLTALHTRGDSLTVDGLAPKTSEVFSAVEQIPGLANARGTGQVRSEHEDDNTAMQRFTITARQVNR